MRIALKVAYIGTDYHGSQIQPDVTTVNGELIRALQELDIINNPREANYQSAGRTDKGVHALGQVIAFDSKNPHIALPRAVNSKLGGLIQVWARAEVSQDFDPRKLAKYREYRYIMPDRYDLSLLQGASRLLTGRHDFFNFATPEKERKTSCTIESLRITEPSDFTIMDIRADHFLWHMVRKIAAAMHLIGRGERDLRWLKMMLCPSLFKEGLEPAPAYGLIFKNVEYEGVTWLEDRYAKKLILKTLDEYFLRYRVIGEVFRELIEGMRKAESSDIL